MKELEWHQMTRRYQGNLIWWAEGEDGYYATYTYEVKDVNGHYWYTTAHRVGPTLRKINAVNAIKRHIDNRVIEAYAKHEGDI